MAISPIQSSNATAVTERRTERVREREAQGEERQVQRRQETERAQAQRSQLAEERQQRDFLTREQLKQSQEAAKPAPGSRVNTTA